MELLQVKLFASLTQLNSQTRTKTQSCLISTVMHFYLCHPVLEKQFPNLSMHFQEEAETHLLVNKLIHFSKCPFLNTLHGVARNQTWLRDFAFTFHFPALEKEMATNSSVLAWRIPGTGKPGGLPSMGSHRVGHDWSDLAAAAARIQKTILGHLWEISEELLWWQVLLSLIYNLGIFNLFYFI